MEEFKTIPGYDGLYEISTFSRVKALAKEVWNGKAYIPKEEKILKQNLNKKTGYLKVNLYNNTKKKCAYIHGLMALTFHDWKGGDRYHVIDHKDNDKLNNHIDNLQIITKRRNTTKEQFRNSHTSKYVGVSRCSHGKKWRAFIYDEKLIGIGTFDNEEDAHVAYQKELLNINEKRSSK